MRKIFYLFLVLIFCVSLFQLKDAHASRRHITELFEKKGMTKAYVSSVENLTGDRNVNIKDIKKSIEEALAKRRSHSFEVVKSEASADITVEVDVQVK